jgi:chromosome segregation ATPase
MKIKHKVVKEFQYLSPDKKIFILKIGAILEEYIYKVKTELIPIDKAIIDNNPEFFEVIDWKAELLTFMRAEKMPQPAQLGKKLIPFFEDMIMSSIQHDNVPSMDPALMKDVERRESELNTFKRDLDRRETDLDSRDRRIKDKEDELEIRIKRVEKREDEYKLDIKTLEKKDDEIRSKNRTITEKELDLQEKSQELNERERNLDRTALSSAKEYDSKYAELQNKIDSDMEKVTQKEKDVEFLLKDIKSRESSLIQQESEISDRERNFEQRLEEVNSEEASLMKEKNELITKKSELENWEKRLIELENSLRLPEAPNVATMPK